MVSPTKNVHITEDGDRHEETHIFINNNFNSIQRQ